MTTTDGIGIGELAARTGLSAHALRYYERAGLITPPVRAPDGARRYDERAQAWVGFLTHLRATGMPIRELRKYAELARGGPGTQPDRLAVLEEHRQRVQAGVVAAREALQAIEAKVEMYRTRIGAPPASDSGPADGVRDEKSSAQAAPVVLVTGTSSGLGRAAAVALAARGCRVVATMRDTGLAGELSSAAAATGVSLDVRRLDVTDDESVPGCVAGVVADYERLDAVVSNAGIAHVGALEHDTLDDVRRVMETNFFGVVRVTRAVLPHLRRSGGRLVTVTSVGGVVGQPFADVYCASKFAVEGLMESLASTVGRLGVQIVVVEPGYIRSRFLDNSNLGTDAPAIPADGYRALRDAYLSRVSAGLASGQSPEEAAEVVVESVLGAHGPLRRQTSTAAERFVGVKLADRDGAAVQELMTNWLDAPPATA